MVKIKHVNKIAIYGAGGFSREVKMLIDQINQKNSEYEFVGFFDDFAEKGKVINGYKILGGMSELNLINFKLGVVVAIGNTSIKENVVKKISNNNIYFPKLIHPSALIGNDNVHIGEGTIICAGNIITVDITIGSHVILNLNCTVGHDTEIGDYCSIMPSVNVSGEVKLANNVYVGTGAKIINKINVGVNSIIGAGAIVVKSLPSNCTAVGVPAKPIQIHEQ